MTNNVKEAYLAWSNYCTCLGGPVMTTDIVLKEGRLVTVERIDHHDPHGCQKHRDILWNEYVRIRDAH